jgi:hypothetical protein
MGYAQYVRNCVSGKQYVHVYIWIMYKPLAPTKDGGLFLMEHPPHDVDVDDV